MSRKNRRERWHKSKHPHDFRISEGPVVRQEIEPHTVIGRDDDVALATRPAAPVLVAIARDPRTIFIYWSIDWSAIFERTAPVDRRVHLLVYHERGSEQQSVAVEPMAGSCYVTVPRRSGPYYVEMGYYQPADVWNSVTISNRVRMPVDDFAVGRDVHLATVPFHLKFQHLLDLVGATDSASLAEVISQIQSGASTIKVRNPLRSEDREFLKRINLSVEEFAAARRAFIASADAAALDRRAEAILSLAASSPW